MGHDHNKMEKWTWNKSGAEKHVFAQGTCEYMYIQEWVLFEHGNYYLERFAKKIREAKSVNCFKTGLDGMDLSKI